MLTRRSFLVRVCAVTLCTSSVVWTTSVTTIQDRIAPTDVPAGDRAGSDSAQASKWPVDRGQRRILEKPLAMSKEPTRQPDNRGAGQRGPTRAGRDGGD